jgi:hypothetical protein
MGPGWRTSAGERPGVVPDRTPGAEVARWAAGLEVAPQVMVEVARPAGPAVARVGPQAAVKVARLEGQRVVRVARLEGQRVAQQEAGAEVPEEQQEAGAEVAQQEGPAVARQAGAPYPDLALRPDWAVFDRSSRNPARFCRSPRAFVKRPVAAPPAILTRQGRILANFIGAARKTRLPLPGGEATVKQLSAPQDVRHTGDPSP